MNAATSLVPAPPQTRTAGGIGASEVAAAIGINPYQRPIDVWLQHTGRAQPFAGNEATRWGHALEPIIRAQYVEDHQVAVHVPPESIWHPSIPWLKATPDGIVIAPGGAWEYVAPQCKNVGLRQSERWEVAPPAEYHVQAIIEMAVTNLDRLDFAVLVGGQDYREFTVHRDRELEADVLEQLAVFMRLVETDTQPAVDASDSFRRHLLGRIDKAGVLVTAPAALEDSIASWRDTVVCIAALEHRQALAKNQVLAFLAEAGAAGVTSPQHGVIKLGAGRRATGWKAVAEQLGAARPTELARLTAEHTTTTDAPLNRPRTWSQE